MFRAIFYAFILLALLGDARIFLFVANRYVYAARRHPKTPNTLLIGFLPPLLIALTALFWPLGVWLDRMLTGSWLDLIDWSFILVKAGGAWLLIASSVGIFWIIDRIRILTSKPLPIEGVTTLDSTIAPYDLEITRHEVQIDDLPPVFDGYRIIFLSDTHVIPSMREYFREVVAQTRALDPDLILLGGDFITWERHIPLMSEALLDGLTARDGVYAVLGNHDYWSDAEKVTAALNARDVTVLTNRSTAIRRNDALLSLAGIDEVYRGNPDVEKAFARVDPSRPCIAFSHHPDIIDEVGNHRIDLLLCGHTHGGQIRIPFFGALMVPSVHEGLYLSGFHRVRNALMYVGRGIGAVPPIRILCKAELPLFTLRATPPDQRTSTSK
jgi:predicted MPP superfamily phosphohydrolase